ncbi:MAG: hypothetical protein K0R43_3260 [Pseudoduganella sp.]|jgi:Flp pilus assembly protein TadG|nr:hypothetical protein [Pseudoduganella sp.]
MRRRHCRGVAAIELAMVLLVCALLLTQCLYYGRLAMSGAVLDRATSDVARYLALVPVESLRDGTQRALVLGNAQVMLEQALADAGVQVLDLQVDFGCGLTGCSVVSPANPLASMSVTAMLRYRDEWFGAAGDVDLLAYAEAGRDN